MDMEFTDVEGQLEGIWACENFIIHSGSLKVIPKDIKGYLHMSIYYRYNSLSLSLRLYIYIYMFIDI